MAGPTAAGKTGLAVELAERVDGEVINADSRQIYRGLDIGTAKPSPAERSRAPHHLVDSAAPDEPFSAGRFARLARREVDRIEDRGRTPLVAGGTGFYIDALVEPMFEEPDVDDERKRQVRARLEAVAAGRGREAVHRRLARIDPASADRLHPNDFQRVGRALEVFFTTGRTLSELHERADSGGEFAPFRVVIDPPEDVLHRRIETRTDAMLAAGWVDEVRRLLAEGADPRSPGMESLGYAEIVAVVRGRLSLAEARERIIVHTRQYARRQRKWFRRWDARLRGDLPELDADRVVREWLEFKNEFDTGRGNERE